MGQYWMPVNLDKREYICPHKLAGGLKLWEQVNNLPGTPVALFILTTSMPEPRGGGDFKPHPAVGRWAGDRIAVIGDYAEDSDLPDSPVPAGIIYSLCHDESEVEDTRKWLRDQITHKPHGPDGEYLKRHRRVLRQLKGQHAFTDVSDMVCEVIEAECDGKFSGDGWRGWVPNQRAEVL
jgi:hypothetical protein